MWGREGKSNCSFHLPNGWLGKKIQCQTLLRGTQEQDRRQWTQLAKREILIGHNKKISSR